MKIIYSVKLPQFTFSVKDYTMAIIYILRSSWNPPLGVSRPTLWGPSAQPVVCTLNVDIPEDTEEQHILSS